ncbi:hypothetical protein BJ944DRAFT_90909 [Cunninghamella echinulata]|nr:hypothetical protein BJ944DRAFT_90909 [Cunninghamella echinulata]
MVKKLANNMDITNVDSSVILYLSLAAQKRLKELLLHSIEISHHRVSSQIVDAPPLDDQDQPVYKVTDVLDIKKQLLAIERVEREEERKRREYIAEKERQASQPDNGTNGGGAGGGGGVDGGDYGDSSMNDSLGGLGEDGTKKKKKKKKDQMISSGGRDLTEDIRKKTTNETNYTALMLAGGVRKSWMLTGLSNASSSSSSINALSSASTLPHSSSSSSLLSPSTSSSSLLSSSNEKDISSFPNSLDDLSQSSPSQQQLQRGNHNNSGRGRPKGGKKGSLLEHQGLKRTKSSIPSFKRDRSQDSFLPPSMLSRHQHKLNEQSSRKVTVLDTIHALEKELEGGCESGNRTLIKSYNRYLK